MPCNYQEIYLFLIPYRRVEGTVFYTSTELQTSLHVKGGAIARNFKKRNLRKGKEDLAYALSFYYSVASSILS
jgi:hypothetical protein